MSLLGIKILGYEIDAAFVFKAMTGLFSILLLLFIIGSNELFDWITKSLLIWTGATMIIVPLTYGFINEELGLKHKVLIISGILLIVFFGFFGNIPLPDLLIRVIQSITWMTLFSIILEAFRKKIE